MTKLLPYPVTVSSVVLLLRLSIGRGGVLNSPRFHVFFIKGIWQYIFILAYRQDPLKQ